MRGGNVARGLMRIRLLKRWNGIGEGASIDTGEGVAQLLIQRGIARPEDVPASDNKSMAVPQRAKALRRKAVGE